jgi:ATP-dependent Lon protease
VVPLFVGRNKSIKALEHAMNLEKSILLVAQADAKKDEPAEQDIHAMGTVGTVLQLLRLPDGTVKALVEGKERGRIVEFLPNPDFFYVEVEVVKETEDNPMEVEALIRSVHTSFEQYVKMNKKIPAEVLQSVQSITAPSQLADTIVAHTNIKLPDKQRLLEMISPAERLQLLFELMRQEAEIMEIEQRIKGRIKKQMEKTQKEYYLNEQMRAIQKEMGGRDEAANEIQELEEALEKKRLSREAKSKVAHEIKKLKMMSPQSAEATVVRNYIETVVNLPWKKKSKISKDISAAQEILDKDHYGLEKVKERIVEYLAVQTRVDKMKAPILCLVGAPGVGKTSLGQSIARATNRKFVRMSLGGVRDEAEIRGHRRTYIGSMPGKIVQNMAKVGVHNPLFLLDEVDKMAMDFRGDPSSALLEVLDPEQNATFNDHYLEVDFDLSEVMFVCTANSLNIPPPLLDRMEVIRLPGYTEDEKLNIARRYLVPKQVKQNGLRAGELKVSDTALLDIVRYYTREAGVRNLEREIAKISRKAVKQLLLEKGAAKGEAKTAARGVAVTPRNLDKFLGVRRFRYGKAEDENRIGQVTGLAWTEVGGELLTIEAAVLPGKGKLQHTGQLGEVMQESIQAAMSVVRSRAEVLGLEPDFYQKHDVHLHMPEGAQPKDGPSAGIGMCTALVSALTKIPVRSDVAMTGEITLRGEVLPIGGLKEKLLAAQRGGIALVMIPQENEKDLVEIPENIKGKLDIRPVRWIDQVLEVALTRQPIPRAVATPAEGGAAPGKRSRRGGKRGSKHVQAH